MAKKIKSMFGSVRFWYAIIIAVAYFLESMNIVPDAYANAIELFSALGISVRQIDKFR